MNANHRNCSNFAKIEVAKGGKKLLGKNKASKTTQWRHYNAMATPMSIEHGPKQILIFISYSCGKVFPMPLNANVVHVSAKAWEASSP